MNLHYVQHVPFEDAGYIKDWADAQGISVSRTRLYLDEPLPAVESVDALVLMGGPMGVNDEAQYAWLKPEKAFIAQVIGTGKTVLGICLGAQLIAQVLGARVYPNGHKEIGWFPVSLSETGRRSETGKLLPLDFYAFHWHGDTFDLPEGAVHLAQSEACRNQAFVYGDRVLGLQCHLESTVASVDRLLENCGSEIQEAPYIQRQDAIQAQADRIAESNRHMGALLGHFLNVS